MNPLFMHYTKLPTSVALFDSVVATTQSNGMYVGLYTIDTCSNMKLVLEIRVNPATKCISRFTF